MKDKWCSPLFTNGHWIYGGAARNKRIGDYGGVEELCKDIAEFAARVAYERATQAAEPAIGDKVVPITKIRRRRMS